MPALAYLNTQDVVYFPFSPQKNALFAIKLAIGIHNIRWIVFDDKLILKFTVENIGGLNSAFVDARPGLIMPHLVWEKNKI